MREWSKKYLGILGFSILLLSASFEIYLRFILECEISFEYGWAGFVTMAAAQTIQDILNQKIFSKYSEKVKTRFIFFVIFSTIFMLATIYHYSLSH